MDSSKQRQEGFHPGSQREHKRQTPLCRVEQVLRPVGQVAPSRLSSNVVSYSSGCGGQKGHCGGENLLARCVEWGWRHWEEEGHR